MDPKISVIIPAFNAEKTIDRCVASVLSQSYKSFELIIVNDGSTDSTGEICASFLYDSRVRLINKLNEGVSTARNTGLDASTGAYILFLDSDDILPKNACEQYVCAMDSGTDWCIADFQRISRGATESRKTLTDILDPGIYQKNTFLQAFGTLYKKHYLNAPWGKCYRSDKITSKFPHESSIGEDLLFNLAYLLNCETISILDASLYLYYIQDNGTLSSSFRMEYFEMLQYVYEQTQTYCQKLGLMVPVFEVDEKYILDMISVFERFARHNWDKRVPGTIRTFYDNLSLSKIFGRTQLSANNKFKIEKYLLQKRKFGLFCIITRTLFCVKQRLYKAVKRE